MPPFHLHINVAVDAKVKSMSTRSYFPFLGDISMAAFGAKWPTCIYYLILIYRKISGLFGSYSY